MNEPRVTMNGNYVYVYRVEHAKHNIGPYRGRLAYSLWGNCKLTQAIENLLDEHVQDLYSWPNIHDDCANYGYHEIAPTYWKWLDTVDNMHCGCESLWNLKIWFGEKHLRALAEVGFVVKLYRVKKTDIYRTRSGRQCAFVKPTFANKILSIESIL